MDVYALEAKEVVSQLQSSQNGLTSSDAKSRLTRYGPNEIEKHKGRSAVSIFFEQFRNFLIFLLIIAASLSAVLGEYAEAIGMGFIILISVILGFIQEYRAEKAVETLRKMSAPTAKVLRDGKIGRIDAILAVPGDILLLESGDIVASDARILDESSLKVDEAALTGESVASEKTSKIFPEGTSLPDRKNMVFMGTIITYGKAKAIVTSTGMNTEFGKIAKSIAETKESRTPLQAKFEEMAKKIGLAVVLLVGMVFALGILFSSQPSIIEMLIFSISLAVAAVPSALPAIVTISLALGANSMAKRNMIIKRLPATESLGSVTYICSDKTGTITRNEMTVTSIYFSGKVIDVSGSGYEPSGEFTHLGSKYEDKNFNEILKIGLLCNNAKLENSGNEWKVIGDPTEGAMVVVAKKAGLSESEILAHESMVKEHPFDSERKMMSVIFKDSKKQKAYVKGAPESIMRRATKIFENGKARAITQKDKKKIAEMNEKFASKALRVLAVAYRELPKNTSYDLKSIEKDLVLVGLVGMMDAPREEVKRAIRLCEEAKIKVMIITGDNPLTTKAVAEQVGLFKEGDLILTGDELDAMDSYEFEKRIEHVKIIARALPLHKLKVVQALKKRGHIVAMTGDGVNDAPALKRADIGIAMGITGSDVAKEVSKAILVDDNFASIVNAISEGRNIYDKILKSARYLLSCNLGEIFTVFLAVLLRMPLPLATLQILLMNLLTDGIPALGLGTESAEDDVMKRSPRNPKDKLFSDHHLMLTIVFGLIMGLGTLFIFNLYLSSGIELARTVAFTTLVMFEMFAVVGSRSLHPFHKLNIFTNKWLALGVAFSISIHIAVVYVEPLQNLFGTVALSWVDWVKILGVSSMGFFAMELGKLSMRSISDKSNTPGNE